MSRSLGVYLVYLHFDRLAGHIGQTRQNGQTEQFGQTLQTSQIRPTRPVLRVWPMCLLRVSVSHGQSVKSGQSS